MRIHCVALMFLSLGIILTTSSCKKKDGCTDPNSLTFDAKAKKDDGSCVVVEQQRKTLILEFAAAWCPPCGSWGNDAFHKMKSDYKGEIVSISSHGTFAQPDGMTNKYSDGFKQNFPIMGWPNFYVGNTSVGTSQDISAEMDYYRALPVVAGGATVYTVGENNITVEARGEFFESVSGEYYLAVYVLESGIPGGDNEPTGFDQLGDNSQDYVHNDVLRRGASDNVFGDKIASGSVSAGTTKDLAYKVPIDPDWNLDKIKLIGMLSEKKGSTYEYVNAWHAIEIFPEEED